MIARPMRGVVRCAVVGTVAVWVCVVAATAGAALRAVQVLTVYAVPVSAQFMNHADDRIRGMSENPFTPSQETLIISDTGSENKKGPFPGDDVLYSYKLYSNAEHTASVGTAFYTCYFNFSHNATCDANYRLGNSELVASGQVTFNATGYTLAITGGSSKYLGVSGQVQGTGAATAEVRLSLDVLPKSGKPLTSMTVYGVVDQVQYVNNADDEARGVANNPFNAQSDALRPNVSWNGVGPFAGDVAVYSVNLYSNARLQHASGSGSLVCYFNYKQNAFCEAEFQIGNANDTLVGSGPVDFDSTRFMLVTTGGTGKFAGDRGELSETPAGKNSERLQFTLAD